MTATIHHGITVEYAPVPDGAPVSFSHRASCLCGWVSCVMPRLDVTEAGRAHMDTATCEVAWCREHHSDPRVPLFCVHYGETLTLAPTVDDSDEYSVADIDARLMQIVDNRGVTHAPRVLIEIEGGETKLDPAGLRSFALWLMERAEQLEEVDSSQSGGTYWPT